jgi:hypothetical protein
VPRGRDVSRSGGAVGISTVILALLAVLSPVSNAMGQSKPSSESDADVTVRAVDALFGRALEGTAVVTSTEGEEQRYSIKDGLARVPAHRSDRGYRVEFDGPGTSRAQIIPPAPATGVTLRVVTILDIVVLILLHLAAVIAFLVARPTGVPVDRPKVGWGLSRRLRRRPETEIRDFVRVRLTTGRIVEGWINSSAPGGEEDEVLSLRPTRAFDSSGRSDVPTPVDSFIPITTIASVESLDESHAGSPTNSSSEQQSAIDLRDHKQAGSK